MVERDELTAPFLRSFPMEPVAGLIVPEAALIALTLAAREVVFNEADQMVSADLINDLDRFSEPFADVLDVPFSEATEKREALRSAAAHVRNWLDAGCITLPPGQHIRALVEAYL